MDTLSALHQKSHVVILATAPTGLGHLRVTRALYHGLPKDVSPILLGAQDQSVSNLYRFISIHPLTRSLMEWTQQGRFEDIFTSWYRLYLQEHNHLLYQQLVTILDERIELPDTVILVATHFGLAHQLGVLKDRLEREKGVKVYLLVQVTDDSPQHIWYVDDADMIFVPSERTKERLIAFGKHAKLPPVQFVVSAYPISPLLGIELSSYQKRQRLSQLSYTNHAEIHVAIPISGAAVGTQFYTTLIDRLSGLSSRYFFEVIAKHSFYTTDFLDKMIQRLCVRVHTSAHDRGIVDMYEKVYLQETISLEVTKPSEQSFKALYTPSQIGGSLLLFAEPVGRQEHDNLDFLKRHRLIPLQSEQVMMWEKAAHDHPLTEHEREKLLLLATFWRGLVLPADAAEAAVFIQWCLREGVFQAMFHHDTKIRKDKDHTQELNPNGVREFWRQIADFVQKQSR